MGRHDTFSERYGPRRHFVPHDEAPAEARAQLARIVKHRSQLFGTHNYEVLLPLVDRVHEELALALGRDVATTVVASPDDPDWAWQVDNAHLEGIGELVHGCQWWEFYEACEELMDIAVSEPAAQKLERELDRLFRRLALPYRMQEGKVVRRFTQLAEQQVSEAFRLLGLDDRFKGAAEQFSKAVGHLNRRPPDPEKSIDDATGALEAVARVITGQRAQTLGKIAGDSGPLVQRLAVDKALAKAISNIYGYASVKPGVRHGATQPLAASPADAELVLHWCAASIVYLVRKHDALNRQPPSPVSPAASS